MLHAISLLLLCGLFVVTSCNNHTENTRDHLVFRYNEHSNITSLDPAFARNPQNIWPTNQLFNGLVQLDDSLNIQPDIAKRWEIVDSTCTYYFTLRKDVFFHRNNVFGIEGTRTVNAFDFEYSFNRLTDATVSSATSLLSSIDMHNKNGFEAINDSTFIIHLSKPFTPFLRILTMKYPRERKLYFIAFAPS